MSSKKNFLFLTCISMAVVLCIVLATSLTVIAAPSVSKITTSTITTDGLTVLSYGKYLNAISFQQDAITSYNGYQYAAYYNSSRHVCIARRQLPSGNWEVVEFTDYTQTANDSHNTISIGICPGDGTIHLSWDHHVSTLHYRKSITGLATNPGSHSWTASKFGSVQNNLNGATITGVTYPRFITAPNNKLQYTHRIGSSGDGDSYLYEYNGSTGIWTTLGKFVEGTTTTPDVCPYYNGFSYDSNNRLHVTWCWRETSDAMTNFNICYAYSDDYGRTWKNNSGTQIGTTGSIYIKTNTSGITVWQIGKNRGLHNAEGQAVDSQGRIHVIMSHVRDSDPNPSNWDAALANSYYFHYWRDSNGTWHRTEIAPKDNWRGKICFDSSDNAYAILPDLKIASASAASSWVDWTIVDATEDNNYKLTEPLYDLSRLKNGDGKLSIFAQEGVNAVTSGKVVVIDYDLNQGTFSQNQNRALNKTVTASSSIETSGWYRIKAVDGQRNTVSPNDRGWNSATSTTNHTEWIKVDLGSAYSINKVDLYPRNDTGYVGEGFPVNFTIQVSTDNTNWTTVVTRTNYPTPANEVQSFTFNSTNARYVKIEGTQLDSIGANNYRMILSEVEVY